MFNFQNFITMKWFALDQLLRKYSGQSLDTLLFGDRATPTIVLEPKFWVGRFLPGSKPGRTLNLAIIDGHFVDRDVCNRSLV